MLTGIKNCLQMLVLLNLFSVAYAENTELTLDQQLIAIKQEMLDLGRKMKVLEDVLLYPPQNKVALYLVKDVGKLFRLQRIKLLINDEVVADYDYSPLEESGLNHGAAHNLYMGNYLPGDYYLTAILEGIGPHGRQHKRAVRHDFTKIKTAKIMALVIFDDVHKQQPMFMVKDIAPCRRC